MSHKTHQIIGSAHATCLPDIFEDNSYSKYVSIFNGNQTKIGEIHLVINVFQMRNVALKTPKRSTNSKSKVYKTIVQDEEINCSPDKEIIDQYFSMKQAKHDKLLKSFNDNVTEKFVSQIVARAEKLRGAILKENQKDSIALSDCSEYSILENNKAENAVKVFDYLIGKNMAIKEDEDVLKSLQVSSPASSIMEVEHQNYQNNVPNKVEVNHQPEAVAAKPEKISENHVNPECVWEKRRGIKFNLGYSLTILICVLCFNLFYH